MSERLWHFKRRYWEIMDQKKGYELEKKKHFGTMVLCLASQMLSPTKNGNIRPPLGPGERFENATYSGLMRQELDLESRSRANSKKAWGHYVLTKYELRKSHVPSPISQMPIYLHERGVWKEYIYQPSPPSFLLSLHYISKSWKPKKKSPIKYDEQDVPPPFQARTCAVHDLKKEIATMDVFRLEFRSHTGYGEMRLGARKKMRKMRHGDAR
ncbi:hypothetical protein CC86DRAFT_386495 [Ophiobolus disseminans]|uniref:Uncharacterized protein n=1 Tax=Ophiobolus disseminans TaxID=1469910 RepID=A0A6A6ZMV1_9PLEO|nr:hypothetical protein CC86DRAFT_386495 [Ophiobolus disseminans]